MGATANHNPLASRDSRPRGAHDLQVFRQKLSEVAQVQVIAFHETEFDLIDARFVGIDGSLRAEFGDAVGREGSLRAVEDQIDAGGALGVDRGPRFALAFDHQVDDLLVVPEELGWSRTVVVPDR